MDNKIFVSVAIITVMLAGIMTVGVAQAAENNYNEEKIKDMIPSTYGETEDALKSMKPIKVRYIKLWTNGGEHWFTGMYGDGKFIAEDNQGKQIWGIYHNGKFAGFQDGNFFVGNYWKTSLGLASWSASGLFGLLEAQGHFYTSAYPMDGLTETGNK